MSVSFDELRLLKGSDYEVNENFIIHHPTVGEICDIGEQKYFQDIFMLTATPSQCKVQLFDKGIDYVEIKDFSLFLMTYRSISPEVSKLIFNGLDISEFVIAQDNENDKTVLYCKDKGIYIDDVVYETIAGYLRKIHFLKRQVEKPGNKSTRKYLIDKDRRRMERNKNKPYESILKCTITALVNCEQFKYSYADVWDIPIYILNDSVRQINRLKNYDSIINGIYTGNIDRQKIDIKQISWIEN